MSSDCASGIFGRVLSIQSHTVQGHVGNKAAVFPLQLLEYEVDPINSVQVSNHTGYPVWKGDILTGDQLWALVEGLEANGLLFYTHLLTGYIGSQSFLETLVKVIQKLRSVNPGLIYVCDPVMGDNGKLYVNPLLVPVYLKQVVPLADVLTPNQFEAEQLTGMRILCEDDAHKVCDALHRAGPEKIVITSIDINGQLLVFGSSQQGVERPTRFRIKIPKLPVYITPTFRHPPVVEILRNCTFTRAQYIGSMTPTNVDPVGGWSEFLTRQIASFILHIPLANIFFHTATSWP